MYTRLELPLDAQFAGWFGYVDCEAPKAAQEMDCRQTGLETMIWKTGRGVNVLKCDQVSVTRTASKSRLEVSRRAQFLSEGDLTRTRNCGWDGFCGRRWRWRKSRRVRYRNEGRRVEGDVEGSSLIKGCDALNRWNLVRPIASGKNKSVDTW